MTTNEVSDNERFGCPDCEQSFNTERGVKIHRGMAHSEESDQTPTYEYECSECDFECHKKRDLVSHRAEEHGFEGFECSECSRKFDSERGLATHKGRMHADETKTGYEYECPKCDFGTDSSRGIQSHRVQKHNDDLSQEIECEVCNTVVERTPSEINEKTFCSWECRSEYLSGKEQPDELVEKRAAAQRDKVKVECDYCGEAFLRTPKRVEKFEHQYCDRECKGKHHSEKFSGSSHPRWSGGAAGIDFIRKHIRDEGWQQTAERVRKEYERTCQMCGSKPSDRDRALDVHHIVPLVAGGTNADGVLLPLCFDCHRSAEAYTRGIVDKHLIAPPDPDPDD